MSNKFYKVCKCSCCYWSNDIIYDHIFICAIKSAITHRFKNELCFYPCIKNIRLLVIRNINNNLIIDIKILRY